MSDPTIDFIEQTGISAKQDGLPRIAGRLMGWFVVNGGPESLGGLAEALSVSRASISTNARILEQLGVLTRVAIPGERQDFYQLADRPYAKMLAGYVYRMQNNIANLDALIDGLPDERADAKQRAEQMRRFYQIAIDNTNSIIDDLQ